ncbi:hypothetical protein HYV44_03735 [Candidatus Microgenomates bacterium]|nr:hypothetical protein [Candidatus Microgenomates bacterium]
MFGWEETQGAENKRKLKELLELRKKYGDNDNALCTLGRSSEGIKQEIEQRTRVHKKHIQTIIKLVILFIIPPIIGTVLSFMGMDDNTTELISMIIFGLIGGVMIYSENKSV